MNFLAHLFLSCENDDLLVGNFIADFISNKEVSNYSLGIQQGINLHRNIDSYTDNHPMVRKGTKRLQPTHRKYSPVVIDIFYDYLLALNWDQYSNEDFSAFRESIYGILDNRMDEMPPKLKLRLPEMIRQDWLKSYTTKAGLEFTFERVKRRTSFHSGMEMATKNLFKDLGKYDEEFKVFFPEVIRFVDHLCNCAPED